MDIDDQMFPEKTLPQQMLVAAKILKTIFGVLSNPYNKDQKGLLHVREIEEENKHLAGLFAERDFVEIWSFLATLVALHSTLVGCSFELA